MAGMTEAEVRDFFGRYERVFEESLAGNLDPREAASFFAPEFIGATPAGVMAGRNDHTLAEALSAGYDHYRATGTREMRIRGVRLSPIDDHHGLVHVAWTAVYDRGAAAPIAIDFEVHYLLQALGEGPRIFGWISGDEQAVLEAHGIT